MTTLTLDEAVDKYGIEKKKLVGFCLRDLLDDPLVVDRDESGAYLVNDDWRLEKLARAASSAGDLQK